MHRNDDLIWTRESRTSKRLTGQLALLGLALVGLAVVGVPLVLIIRSLG